MDLTSFAIPLDRQRGAAEDDRTEVRVVILTRITRMAFACEGDPLSSSTISVEWLDESVPSLALTAGIDRDRVVTANVVALCGQEVEVWSIPDVDVPAGETVALTVPGVADLESLEWADYGVRLAIRLDILDAATGTVLDFASAPERWVWFDAGWELVSSQEVVDRLGGGSPGPGEVVVAVLPPAVTYVGVE